MAWAPLLSHDWYTPLSACTSSTTLVSGFVRVMRPVFSMHHTWLSGPQTKSQGTVMSSANTCTSSVVWAQVPAVQLQAMHAMHPIIQPFISVFMGAKLGGSVVRKKGAGAKPQRRFVNGREKGKSSVHAFAGQQRHNRAHHANAEIA